MANKIAASTMMGGGGSGECVGGDGVGGDGGGVGDLSWLWSSSRATRMTNDGSFFVDGREGRR